MKSVYELTATLRGICMGCRSKEDALKKIEQHGYGKLIEIVKKCRFYMDLR